MIVYRKTGLGKQTLQMANAPLALAERAILVVINGQLTVDELVHRYSKLGAIADILVALESRGLIEVDQAQGKMSEADFLALRDELAELVTQRFGFMAGPLVAQVKSCGDHSALVKCAEHCRDVIRESQSPRKAALFWELAKQCLRI